MNCCTANGSQGLYYVWDSIVDDQDDLARINLLLNRLSPSVDVVSWLPYQGKVELRNKRTQRLTARIPNWVDRSAVKISLFDNGQVIRPVWIGNYLWLGKVAAGRTVQVSFPVVETVETYLAASYEFRGTKYLGRYKYTITFRGHTVVHMNPLPKDGYATYAHRRYRSDTAPQVTASAYVAAQRIDW